MYQLKFYKKTANQYTQIAQFIAQEKHSGDFDYLKREELLREIKELKL